MVRRSSNKDKKEREINRAGATNTYPGHRRHYKPSVNPALVFFRRRGIQDTFVVVRIPILIFVVGGRYASWAGFACLPNAPLHTARDFIGAALRRRLERKAGS
jgi:hypothetical protein